MRFAAFKSKPNEKQDGGNLPTRKIMQDQMSLKSLYQSPLPPPPNVNVEGLAVMYCGVVSTNIELWGPGDGFSKI